MALPAGQAGPLEDLIIDGRVRTVSYELRTDVVILDIDFDRLHAGFVSLMRSTYDHHTPILHRYVGTATVINNNLLADIGHLATYACWVCYNRLRSATERYSADTRVLRMNPRAPVSNRMEFPAFISQLIQSIGPLRISDAPSEILVLYASSAARMQTFGRSAAQAPVEANYHRLLSILRELNFTLSSVDMEPNPGAYWPTCIATETDGLHNVVGTVHRSHYSNNDVPFALCFSMLNWPFQSPTFTVGYVDTTAAVNALAALAPPPGTPAHTTANTPGRPVGFLFNVNHLGIRPSVDAAAATPASTAGFYVVGRGDTPIFTCYLAQHITDYELYAITRYYMSR